MRWLANSYTLRKIADNIFWLVFDKVTRLLIGTAVVLWIAHYLGPSKFGMYAYVIAFVAVFAEFARLALDYMVIKELVEHPDSYVRILSTAFWLKLLGGTLALAAAFIIATIVAPQPSDLLLLIFVASLSLIFQSLDAADFWFQAKVESRISAILSAINFVAFCFIKSALIIAEADLQAFIWANSLEALCLGILLLLRYANRHKSLPFLKPDVPLALKLIHQTWPLTLSGLVIMLFMRLDQLIIGSLQGDATLGIYAAAVRISEATYFVPMAIVMSVSPLIVKAKQESQAAYMAQLTNLFRVLSLLGVLAALFVSAAGWLLLSLLGEQYSAAKTILVVHAWTAVFVFLGIAQSPWIINENRQMFSLQRGLIGVLVKGAGCLLLIPVFGLIGAAVACILGVACAYAFSNLLYRDSRPILAMQFRALIEFPRLKEVVVGRIG